MKNYLKKSILYIFVFTLLSGLLPLSNLTKVNAANGVKVTVKKVTSKDKKVTGTVKIPKKKNQVYKVKVKIGKKSYVKKYTVLKKKSSFNFTVNIKSARKAKTKIQVIVLSKKGKKWKTVAKKTVKVQKYVPKKKKKNTSSKKDTSSNKDAKKDGSSNSSSDYDDYYYDDYDDDDDYDYEDYDKLPGEQHDEDGLYVSTNERKNYRGYITNYLCYWYNGKKSQPYTLPHDVEVKLARESTYLKDYFDFFDKYYTATNNRTLAALTAINHFIVHKLGGSNNDVTGYISRDWAVPILYGSGTCHAYCSLVTYLCYLSDVDCVYVLLPNNNHAVCAVEYNSQWYFVEGVNIHWVEDNYYTSFQRERYLCDTLDPKYLLTMKEFIRNSDCGKNIAFRIDNNYGYNEKVKTASGHIPTNKELITFNGKSELLNYSHEDFEYSLLHDLNEQISRDATIEPVNWESFGVKNGVVVDSIKRLLVSKTYEGKSVKQDLSQHINFVSADESIAKVEYSQSDTYVCNVRGVSPGTTTITADIEGRKISWEVTVIEWNPLY